MTAIRTNTAKRTALRLATVAAMTGAVTMLGLPAAHADVTNQGADAIAAAIAAPATVVTDARWEPSDPPAAAGGVGGPSLAGFPTQGGTFGVLSTGDATIAHDPSVTTPSVQNGGLTIRGGFDVSTLAIDFTVAPRMNCLRFDFRFFTEEFGSAYFQDKYNDAFIAELDAVDWQVNPDSLDPGNNFAFDGAGNPISVRSLGATSLSAAAADGTPYAGATGVLTASTIVTPGDHTLYLSILDVLDEQNDSVVFIDNLVVGYLPDPEERCTEGAKPKEFSLALTPATATNPVGANHQVVATVTELDEGPVSGGTVLFAVDGAHTTGDDATTDGAGSAIFSYTGTAVGDDVITACFDVNDNDDCDAGEPFATVVANWTAPTTNDVPPGGGLADTSLTTGTLVTVAALLIGAGAGAVVISRRRRANPANR